MSPPDEWIGVAEVSAELHIPPRRALNLIRRLGVPMLEPARAGIHTARFRRSDWEAHRDAGTKPPPPRAPRAAPAPPPSARPKGSNAAAMLAKLRGA